MNLTWIKSTTSSWLNLAKVNLSSVNTNGVYVIWKPGSPARVIRVGQGNIADRLSQHRQSTEITKYGSDLLVTWARVDARYLDGIERYLAERFSPVVGDRFPAVSPIAVNLP